MTDKDGNVARRYDYLPWGEEIPVGAGGRTAAMGYQFDPSRYTLTGGQDGFNPKFTGQMRDWESGLDYFHARYYSPAQGRFVAADPDNAGADLANSKTWNGYAYVGNNPLSITDPSGLNFGDFLGGVIHGILNAASGGFWGAFTSIVNGQTPEIGSVASLPGIGGLTGCGGALGSCGGFGSGSWSESSGLGNVRDPGRFVSDFNSLRHWDFTTYAGGPWILAVGVALVDVWPTSQRTDSAHTSWHAMAGRTTSGKTQTCGQAYQTAIDELNHLNRGGAKGSYIDVSRAVHLVQDSYSSSHGYGAWVGGLIPPAGHRAADGQFSTAAIESTRKYLQGVSNGIGSGTPLGRAEEYLAPPPRGCR